MSCVSTPRGSIFCKALCRLRGTLRDTGRSAARGASSAIADSEAANSPLLDLYCSGSCILIHSAAAIAIFHDAEVAAIVLFVLA